MVNPYQPPNSPAQEERFAIARRKLLIGTICLAIAGIACAAVAIFAAYSWLSSRNDEVQSTLQPLLPILGAVHLILGFAIAVSLWGLAKKRSWSQNWSLVCLGISCCSALLPISAFGIWALLDYHVKLYIKQANPVV